MNGWKRSRILIFVSYVLVAAIASCATLFLFGGGEENTKLEQLQEIIDKYYIGEVTQTQLKDGAAQGMVAATGDRWSYYIPASEYAAHMQNLQNEYVGIGITVATQAEEQGYAVLAVDAQGGAAEAGILAGDIIHAVAGEETAKVGLDKTRENIRGEELTKVQVTVYRDGQLHTFEVVRKKILVEVAKWQMLPDNIGLVTIENFDERCAEETLAAIDAVVEQGATALIFDVRFNPGGFKKELVRILDYLLPEVPIFRSISYTGEETVTHSDAQCLELPMAVLINDSSYSAAEFFAATLSEYEKAVLVGQATTGKSYFQNTYTLSDGSAVGLSVGKYCTPKGVSLADVGGLKPDIEVQVDKQTLQKIYADILEPSQDPQIQAAVEALRQ